MIVTKFTISRDDSIYEAFPDVVLTISEKLLCLFVECTHHMDRGYTRIVICESTDRGRTWSRKTTICESTKGSGYYFNNPRIQQLKDGRLVIVVDRVIGKVEDALREKSVIVLYFSSDEGVTWSEPVDTSVCGMGPDKICETHTGRWLLGCHFNDLDFGHLVQGLWYSDDKGKSWQGPVIVAKKKDLIFCEVSILPVKNKLVAFLREDSFTGLDCFKTVSGDDGETWNEPVEFPLPGCHR
ncbi:MAG: exo-alpha-sialidase, partial [Candidatus Latescibacteria bacterium]|nr:exo-alpha-sialidase [Candidatus Latescibacterota bacterium]